MVVVGGVFCLFVLALCWLCFGFVLGFCVLFGWFCGFFLVVVVFVASSVELASKSHCPGV